MRPIIKTIIFIGVCLLINTAVFPLKNLDAAKKESFRIALTGKYPPFNFYSKEGKLVGFDVDIAKKISKYLNRKLLITTTEWDGILAGLLTGKYDAIIGSMAITPERAKSVNFSTPYYVSGAQLFVHKKNRGEIKNIVDLYGKKVGVGVGETYEHYLQKNHPSVELVAYKSTVDIFQDMLNGRLQGFVTDKLVGLYQLKNSNMPFVAVGPLLYKEQMGIPVTKDNKKLLKKINSALVNLKKRGELKKLHQKWFGSINVSDTKLKSDMPARIVIKKLGHGFAITLFVAFVSLLLGFVLAVPWGVVLNNQKFFFYKIFRFINDFIRGTPLLIQLFFVYFGGPQIGIMLSPINSAIITLTINSAAYMAEVVRSGLMAVDRGQNLAGRALGFTKLQVFHFIVWPQAFRIAMPPLMNSVVAFLKDTALISVISVSEVIREAQSIISVTYAPMKYYFIVAIMFFVFTFPLMKLAGKVEENIKKKGFVQ